MSDKHPPAGREPDPPPMDDLECDPGIGSSVGTTIAGENPTADAGENTREGDVENDTTAGGIDPGQRGRSHP